MFVSFLDRSPLLFRGTLTFSFATIIIFLISGRKYSHEDIFIRYLATDGPVNGDNRAGKKNKMGNDHEGINIASITWISPLLVLILAIITFASSIITDPFTVETVRFPPCAVFNTFTCWISATINFPGTTW